MKQKQKPQTGDRAAIPKSEQPDAAARPSARSPKAAEPAAAVTRITPEMLASNARVAIAAGVIQRMHRHARSSMHAEICGVLIGEESNGTTVIEAAIEGEGATQGGAHVTFTQDTWEHIYSVKDRDYPEKRIVGWYHSHPGFGIFLSQQDLFIHENFFSSPAQVAWVYDPHSDEEGCFGWVEGSVRRLREVRVIDVASADAPVVGEEPDEIPLTEEEDAPERLGGVERPAAGQSGKAILMRRLLLLLALAVVFVGGFAAGILVFPPIVMYSMPDGRLMNEREMKAAVERALQREKEIHERLQGLPGTGAETNREPRAVPSPTPPKPQP